MRHFFSVLKQAWHRTILLLAIVSLLSLSGLFISQPSHAATSNQKLVQQEKMDRDSQNANQRAQAYEEQVEAAKDPDKVYEENVKSFKESHPGENFVGKAVEGAKEAVENVTGK